jgi:c-di-GMP phosphodiesterase
MIYNILLIDETESGITTKRLLNDLKNKEIAICNDKYTLVNFLKYNDIHLIIINPNIIHLKKLETIIHKYHLKYDLLPIIILGQSLSEYESGTTDLLIYDYVDIGFTKEVIYNKIQFCQKLYEKELEYEYNLKKLLYIDSLTGLPNRVKLIKDVQENSNNIDALAVIDINSFKEINDFFGHKTGDNILKAVVDIIRKLIYFVEDNVELYKFSADVYCLANQGLYHEEFENLITYILGAMESEVFEIEEHEIDVRATAGITFSTRNNKLITADIALQAAKKQNKDYVVFYEELDNLREYQNNMLWTKKLKKALERDNVIVYYQPLVNNITMKVDKYECLVRLYDEDEDKIVSPFFFLEVAKRANQYANITKIVIEKAFKEFADKEFEFSLNVSYEDIEDKHLLFFIEDRLRHYPGIANRVVWEILEDEGIRNYDVLLEFIQEIKKLGCKIAIDDFGSGYSNFEHLLKMDADYLKIDASLIKNIVTDQNSHKVVRAVVDFAKSLDIKTIAEYVESQDILDLVQKMGINFSQGYHFSAPIPKPTLYSFEEN